MIHKSSSNAGDNQRKQSINCDEYLRINIHLLDFTAGCDSFGRVTRLQVKPHLA